MSEQLTAEQRLEASCNGNKSMWIYFGMNPSLKKAAMDAIRAAEIASEKRTWEEAAKIAWKMQQENFGGGTAIGNALQDRATDLKTDQRSDGPTSEQANEILGKEHY